MARVTQFVVWLLLLIPVSMKAQTESKPSLVALKTNQCTNICSLK